MERKGEKKDTESGAEVEKVDGTPTKHTHTESERVRDAAKRKLGLLALTTQNS